MPSLPERPNLSHLKTQAKDLLRGYRRGDPSAAVRLRQWLPAARGKDDAALDALALRLHDAQSCVAREYGFASWTDLKAFVDARAAERASREVLLRTWLPLVYGGGFLRSNPAAAARLLEHRPDVTGTDPLLACATGDVPRVRAAIDRDPVWVNRPGGPLDMPPLVATTHSGLARLTAWSDRLLRCTKLLLGAGADPNQSWVDPVFPTHRLSALYGAAGKQHHEGMTRALLDAGANPNDGESLYHAVESADPTCARRLLDAGAAIEGTNALFHALDFEPLTPVELLLFRGADPNARLRGTRPIHHAIWRGRSAAHIAALLAAGADPTAMNAEGLTPYRLALRYGYLAVAALLRPRGLEEPIAPEEAFVAACARADRASAAALLRRDPDLLRRLSTDQLRVLPDCTAAGRADAVRVMVELGWPIDVRGGDWDASALNLAVFQGDADLTAWLLAHGADWRSEHGYHDNVMGTLSFASTAERVEGGDWLGCARALLAAGMPLPPPVYRFSDEVAECFTEAAQASGRG